MVAGENGFICHLLCWLWCLAPLQGTGPCQIQRCDLGPFSLGGLVGPYEKIGLAVPSPPRKWRGRSDTWPEASMQGTILALASAYRWVWRGSGKVYGKKQPWRAAVVQERVSASTGGLSSRQRNFRVAWRCLSRSLPVSPGGSGWLCGAAGDPTRLCWAPPARLVPVQPRHGEPVAPQSPGQQIPYYNTQGDVGFFWCIVIEPPQGES